MSTHDSPHSDDADRWLLDCLDGPVASWRARIDSLCAAEPRIGAEVRRRFERLLAMGLLPREQAQRPAPSLERMDHYRIVRRLGGGGMGVVYEAWDEQLERRVALKLIRGHLGLHSGSRERFEREMRTASRIDHANLCPIYDAGESEGIPYIAMRYVEGRSLAEWIEQRRRDRGSTGKPWRRDTGRGRDECLVLVEKLARALHAAHEAGLVHRDVKPQNVLIDRDGEPVLIDFGLARDTSSELTALTRTGEQLGTPAYMAPEQVAGRAPVDRRTDVHALGVLLYECLTLRRPFDSGTREGLYRQILTEPPRDPRSFDRAFESDLCVVLGKALEKAPADRFATAEELADELRRIRLREPILSRPPGLPLRALRWSQRNRVATTVLCATLLGLAVSLVLLRRSTLAEARAQRSLTEFRALAWLQAAGEAEQHDPELAFKYAREALRLHADPVILAKVQEIMFQLRRYAPLGNLLASFAQFSPDGRAVVVTAQNQAAQLFRRVDGGWQEVQLEDTGWRATAQLVPPPAVFSPDGLELALRGLSTCTVHRYDLRGEEPRALATSTLDGHSALWRVRYHPDPDDHRFLTVVGSGSTSIWSRDGQRLVELDPPEGVQGTWSDAAFLPGGRVVAAGAIFREDGERLAVLPVSGAVDPVLVTEDRFLTVSYDYPHSFDFLVQAFDFDGRPLGEPCLLRSHDKRDYLRSVELDSSGTRLLVTTRSRLRLIDASSFEALSAWGNVAGGAAVFSPDGGLVAVCDHRGRVRIRDLEGALVDSFSTGGSGGTLCWSPGGEELVSTGLRARVWSFELPEGIPGSPGLGRPDVAVSSAGDAVVVSSDRQGVLRLFDAHGELQRERSADLGVSHVAFVGDGLVAVGSELRRGLITWDTSASPGATDVVELEPPFLLGDCPPAMLADDRWLLLDGSYTGLPLTWSAGGEPQPFANQVCLHASTSEDRKQVLLCGLGGPWIAGIDGRKRWRPPREERIQARFARLSSDARTVLAAGSDARIYLWDLEAPERPVSVYSGHQAPVECVDFSVDGARLASASEDGSIRVWDRASRRTTLSLYHDGVQRIAFTAGGQLVTAGEDGTVRWWWIDAAPLRRAVERLEVPGLTEMERDRVGHLVSR